MKLTGTGLGRQGLHPLLRAGGSRNVEETLRDGDGPQVAIGGGLVFGTTAMSIAAVFGALSISLPQVPVAGRVAIAAIWGVLLFNLERSMMHSIGEKRTVRLVKGLLRSLLAAIIAVFVAGVLAVLIYSGSIAPQLLAINNRHIAALTTAARMTSPPAQDAAGQQADIASKQDDITKQQGLAQSAHSATLAADRTWDCEAAGTCGTMKAGDSAHAATDYQLYMAAQGNETNVDQQAAAAITADKNAITTDQSNIANDNTQIANIVAKIQKSYGADNDLLARQEALNALFKTDPTARTHYDELAGLLFVVDLSAALFALLAPPTKAHKRRATEDQVDAIQADQTVDLARHSPLIRQSLEAIATNAAACDEEVTIAAQRAVAKKTIGDLSVQGARNDARTAILLARIQARKDRAARHPLLYPGRGAWGAGVAVLAAAAIAVAGLAITGRSDGPLQTKTAAVSSTTTTGDIIDASKTTEVPLGNGGTLMVPPGAITNKAVVTVTPITSSTRTGHDDTILPAPVAAGDSLTTADTPSMANARVLAATPAVKLDVRKGKIRSAMTMSWPVTAPLPPGATPGISTYNTTTRTWDPVPSTYNTTTHTVTAEATHFSSWLSDININDLGQAVGQLFELRTAAPSCSQAPNWADYDVSSAGSLATFQACVGADPHNSNEADVTVVSNEPFGQILTVTGAPLACAWEANGLDSFHNLGVALSNYGFDEFGTSNTIYLAGKTTATLCFAQGSWSAAQITAKVNNQSLVDDIVAKRLSTQGVSVGDFANQFVNDLQKYLNSHNAFPPALSTLLTIGQSLKNVTDLTAAGVLTALEKLAGGLYNAASVSNINGGDGFSDETLAKYLTTFGDLRDAAKAAGIVLPAAQALASAVQEEEARAGWLLGSVELTDAAKAIHPKPTPTTATVPATTPTVPATTPTVPATTPTVPPTTTTVPTTTTTTAVPTTAPPAPAPTNTTTEPPTTTTEPSAGSPLVVNASSAFGLCTAPNTPRYCGADAHAQSSPAFEPNGGVDEPGGTPTTGLCWTTGENIEAPATNETSNIWIKTTFNPDPWMNSMYFAPGAQNGLPTC